LALLAAFNIEQAKIAILLWLSRLPGLRSHQGRLISDARRYAWQDVLPAIRRPFEHGSRDHCPVST
jgi:hypothetical protein